MARTGRDEQRETNYAIIREERADTNGKNEPNYVNSELHFVANLVFLR
jgi:hypothetical protein